MDTANPARLYALVFGLVLVAAGILGFFYSSDFGDPGDVDGVLGAVYIVVAIWGFIVGDGDAILSIIPVNTEDNILHLLIGVAGLAAGAASPTAAPGVERTA
jgi:RsiW-degrading membrane proteinase PrsW (M82 family)